MGLTPRQRTRGVVAALAVVAVVAAIDGARTWRQHQWNAMIAARQVPDDAADPPVQAQFAQAWAQAASGADEAAMKRYRLLQGDAALGQAARYNSANLLMRQAVVVRAGISPGKAIPLIELAKEMYRDVLRADPQHWDARYNLERAQRLLPDPEEVDLAPTEGQRNAERAATTMRGWSPGLP
ncbi:MxaK protein [Ideonella sp. A 288]|uniref:MxaK protein n=1 Tax=Ideonella sp. A 288 TaxID=1962181 RepID=UPI000B4A798B|nr:MxaK protein [Ideonella sp. A 288]